MASTGGAVFASPDEAVPAVRLGGLLALAATATGLSLAVFLARTTAEDTVPLLALLALVGLVGGVCVVAPERMPAAAVVATLLATTASIALGMVIVGPEAVDGADNEVLFLLPALYAAYFCRGWVTALVAATASTTYAAALLLNDAAMPAARWWTTTYALAIVAGLVTVVRRHDVRRISAASAEAGRDPLTGLLNRRGLAAAAPTRRPVAVPLSLLVVDVDHFKAVNDSHGHAVGDEVLVRLAAALEGGSRSGDLVVRLGGDEFALVLPDCDADDASRRAESLRRSVAAASATWAAPVTVSVGTATSSGAPVNVTALLVSADRALFAAKAAGRNTVRAT